MKVDTTCLICSLGILYDVTCRIVIGRLPNIFLYNCVMMWYDCANIKLLENDMDNRLLTAAYFYFGLYYFYNEAYFGYAAKG